MSWIQWTSLPFQKIVIRQLGKVSLIGQNYFLQVSSNFRKEATTIENGIDSIGSTDESWFCGEQLHEVGACRRKKKCARPKASDTQPGSESFLVRKPLQKRL